VAIKDDGLQQPFDGTQTRINRTRLDNPKVLSAPVWGELRVFLAVAKARSELATVLSSLDERLFAISRDLAAENRDTEGHVRVSATEALAALFIAPAVAGFNSRYPGIRLHIQNPSHLVNFKENNTDIMLSFVPGSGAVASKACGSIHFVPVASRSYIETYGMPAPVR
jgi:DNA-binding transcriptional LysR family regulator